MCGLTGHIGRSTNEQVQKLSYQLAKTLLAKTLIRGPHATGIYTYYPNPEAKEKSKLYTYKLAAPSDDYVKTKEFKKLKDFDPFLLLGHCRFYTNGTPAEHKNNHPHLSDDNRTALTHNGVISGFSGLEKTYPCKSDCDSEVILRIIESEDDIIEGIRKVYRLMELGDTFACMVSRWDPETEVAHLYCFRNKGRPLCYIDLRDEWGQIHFASTEDIMKQSLEKSGLPKAIQKTKIIEVPEDEIWHIDSETMEFSKFETEEVEEVTTTYCNRNKNFPPAKTDLSSANDDTAPIKAMIDAIVENITEIDENVRLKELACYGGLKGLESQLREAAFKLETIVNPSLVNDEDDDSLVDEEYFD